MCIRDRIGGGHVRIGAVIQIQKGTLRTFKDDVFAFFEGIIDEQRGIGDILSQLIEMCIRDRLLLP